MLKTAAPGAHKTETGGVALNLSDEAELREATARLGVPAIVQPMIRATRSHGGRSPGSGLRAARRVRPGGVFAELFGQAQMRIAPLTDADAGELVLGGKAGGLVRGFRGPGCDAPALIDLVQRLSRLADDLPEVAELDLNPVMGMAGGCVVADARVRLPSPWPCAGPGKW